MLPAWRSEPNLVDRSKPVPLPPSCWDAASWADAKTKGLVPDQGDVCFIGGDAGADAVGCKSGELRQQELRVETCVTLLH